MTTAAPGGRVRRVVVRSLIVVVVGAAVLAPILYYASTVDLRPPEVNRFSLTQHLPGNDDIALTTASVEVVFSETVDHDSAQAAFRIQPSVIGSFSWSGATMIFTPRQRLPLETAFAISLHAGVRDRAGNAMGGAGPFGFRTVGGPTVIASQPANDQQDVPVDATIKLTFSTLMDTLSVQNALSLIPHTPVELRWSGEQLTVIPQAELQSGQTYQLVIGSQARDVAGTALDPLHLAFTTLAAGLTARSQMPAPDTQGIAVTTPIAVVFDRAIDPASVSDRALTISPAVPGGVSLTPLEGAAGLEDDANRLLRFIPSGPLPPTTTFTMTLANSVRAVDGSLLARPLTWTFTTGAPSTTLSNQVVFLSTRAGITNLWAMNPDGSNQHQVSAEVSPVSSYAVSPDGREFVVGDGVRLVEQRADGSGRRVLTDTGLVEFDPTYTPDGSAIAFGRADAVTGSGLGLWRRGAGGGNAERMTLVAAASQPPSPSPSGSGGSAAVALLRAPRFSPDGTHMAFIDLSGAVGIAEVSTGRVNVAVFHGVTPPTWLPDGSAAVVSGTRDPQAAALPGGILTPGTSVPPLTPFGLRLTAGERASLVVVKIAASDGTLSTPALSIGATLPAVGGEGRIAYVVLDPADPQAGRLWITNAGLTFSTELHPGGAGFESSVAFAPESDVLVVARQPPASQPGAAPSASPPHTPSQSASASPSAATQRTVGGVWLVTLSNGASVQLSADGWLPSWLP